MKNLTLLMILIFCFTLYSQDKKDAGNTDEQTEETMNKIAADPEMRITMLNLMISRTEGSREERLELVNALLGNPEMKKMIFASRSAENKNSTLQPRGVTNDSSGVKRAYKMESIPTKQ